MASVISSASDSKNASNISINSPFNYENNVEDLENLEGTIIDNWNVHEIIGKGAFGYVYRCSTKTKEGTLHEAAIKCEKKISSNNASFLKVECTILLKLSKNGNTGNFTIPYSTGERHNFDYMIMTLLGPNLFDICAFLPGEKMEVGTWVRVMYQALSAIQSLHQINYIHLDIKPANFALGHRNDRIRSQVVHLLDFGLSRRYGSRSKPRTPTYCSPKLGVEYVGTITHCSPNAHLRIELSRRDDMWSWLFMCMDLYNELPWRELHDEQEIENLKINATYQLYCEYLPKRFHIIIEHIMNLGTYDSPDYDLCFTQLLFIMKDKNIKITDRYQWENLPNETKEILRLKIETKTEITFMNENMRQKLTSLSCEKKQNSGEDNSKKLNNRRNVCHQQEKVACRESENDLQHKNDSIEDVKGKKCTSKKASIEHRITRKKKILNEEMKNRACTEKKNHQNETAVHSIKNPPIKNKENSFKEIKMEVSKKKVSNSCEIKKTQSQNSFEANHNHQQNKSIYKNKKSNNNDVFHKISNFSPFSRIAKRRKHFKKLPAVDFDPKMVVKIQKRFKDKMLQKSRHKVCPKEVIENGIKKEKNIPNVISKMADDYKQFIVQNTQTD
uniref:Protein kinase domain-containing protein n=1 Tax=Strongyloides papillosus TaxID=174720 RepID=A0A0N5C7P8_STREA